MNKDEITENFRKYYKMKEAHKDEIDSHLVMLKTRPRHERIKYLIKKLEKSKKTESNFFIFSNCFLQLKEQAIKEFEIKKGESIERFFNHFVTLTPNDSIDFLKLIGDIDLINTALCKLKKFEEGCNNET